MLWRKGAGGKVALPKLGKVAKLAKKVKEGVSTCVERRRDFLFALFSFFASGVVGVYHAMITEHSTKG